LQYSFRLYLNNAARKRILGKGGAQILDAIDKHGSIVRAADNLDMSYKFVWDYLVRIQERLSAPATVTRRGGASSGRKRGGGGTTLTPQARTLLKEFKSTEALLCSILSKRSTKLTVREVTDRGRVKGKRKPRAT
jgi:molybdate transport system regulatory protein